MGALATHIAESGLKPMAIAADKKYKVVMLGDSTVGKSSILYRLKFSSFSGKQESTIGCEFFAKPIPIPERPDQPVKLLIWDSAGQEVFRSFTPNFLRGALAGIICYDITSRESFEHASGWLEDLKKARNDEAIVALVGNKKDLADEKPGSRQVTFAEGEARAKEFGAAVFHETSAKTGLAIDKVFEDVARQLTVHATQFATGTAGGDVRLLDNQNERKGCAC